MITAERIEEMATSMQLELIRHIRTKGIYMVTHIIQVKVDGEWRYLVSYTPVDVEGSGSGPYGRLLKDFEGFEEMK